MTEIKTNVLRLRQAGKTYSEIVKELKISRGTVSYHCQSLENNQGIRHKNLEERYSNLSEKEKENLERLISLNIHKGRQFRQEKRSFGKQLAKDNQGDFILRDAVMIYICEGSKVSSVKLANSDPIIHRKFLDFIEKYFPQHKKTVSCISYLNGISKERVQSYWKKELGILEIKRHVIRDGSTTSQNCPYGTLYISIINIPGLINIIQGMIQEIVGKEFDD